MTLTEDTVLTLSDTEPVTVTVVDRMTAFSVGDVIVVVGPEVARVTDLLTDVLFPGTSVAATVIVLLPALRLTDFEKDPSEDSITLVPFTVTLFTPLVSVTLPVTVTELEVVTKPLLGDVIEIVGAVMSRTTVIVLVVLRLTEFVATTVIVFAPSLRLTDLENDPFVTVTAVPFTVTLDTVLTESLTVPVTVTDVARITAFSLGVVIVSVGPDVALVTVRVTVVVFPNVSVATTVIVFDPADKLIDLENAPFVTVVVELFILTLLTPFVSETVPLTVIDVDAVTRLLDGAVTFKVGPVVSRVTLLVTVVVKSTAFVATTVKVFDPSERFTVAL